MLTAEQIAALRDKAQQITDPINDFLLEDIARRISEAGQLTSSAAYQIWRAQKLGMSQREVKKKLQKLLRTSRKEINKLLTQSAEVGYRFDLDKLPTSAAIPFEKNASLQQIVETAVKLAQEDFTNLTQTLGMVDPHGNALPLQDVYRSCTDFAFKQVITGATDYNTAIRRATKNLAAKGVRVIDYESGVHTSLEAAVRRNIIGGLGLMQEQITQHNHDTLGADGWEISAHANSAPDHEPIQGKQYSDAEYERLNNSLVRRIGTLNCGHAAFPIIMGVNEPQYTPEELEKFRADNAKGITYEGKHYSGYEATQMQRKLERAIRTQKRRILTAEATGDKEMLSVAQTRLQVLRQEYSRFSKATGLRAENERAQVVGFGRKQAAKASASVKSIEKQRRLEYNRRQEETRVLIFSDRTIKTINAGHQNKHIKTSKGYIPGRSYIYGDVETAQRLVDKYHGTGQLVFNRKGEWAKRETVTHDSAIGVCVDPSTLAEMATRRFTIHYGKNGSHIVPAKELEA